MSNASEDSGFVDNWQSGKTIIECNLHMLTTEDCSDVTFLVGPAKHEVRAHRYILVSRSCVFHAMFCGPLAEKGEVTIPDIELHIFRDFLRYLYTDDINITAANVPGLMYTSRKYAVDSLLNQCGVFLDQSLSEETVCQILEQCHSYHELDLEQRAEKILLEAGERVPNSVGFTDLCRECFSKFLKSEDLYLREELVFDAALLWVREECRKENLDTTPENLKQVLGELKYEIRFPNLSFEYLSNVVRQSNILTSDERLQIFDRKSNEDLDISPFKTTSRKQAETTRQIVLHTVERFASVNPDNVWRCNGQQETISFSVSKDIELMGCQLFGSANDDKSAYSLNIEVYDDQNHVIDNPVRRSEKTLQGLEAVNDILFPVPIPLTAGRT